MLLAAWIVPAALAGAPLEEFGSGILTHHALASPIVLDLDGDGRLDAVRAVRIAPGARPAPRVHAANPWRGRPLPARGAPLALAITHASGRRHLLHDAEFFATPIWGSAPLPLEPVRRGSPRYRTLARLAKPAKGDLLLVGTEAGIDLVLYWDGRRYVLAAPDETP